MSDAPGRINPYNNGLRKITFATTLMLLALMTLLIYQVQATRSKAIEAAASATYNRKLLDERKPLVTDIPQLRKEFERLKLAQQEGDREDKHQQAVLQHDMEILVSSLGEKRRIGK